MTKTQNELVQAEIETSLRKEAIFQTDHKQEEFIILLFFVEKNDRGQRPVINLINLNFFVPYEHFKMKV